MIRKAFVYAAGLGTRLRPYTHETPKPLLEVEGRPILEYILRWLAHAGITDVTANTWHLAEQFEAMPTRAAAFGVDLKLSRQPQRFEHGGDLAYARAFLARLGDDERFLGLNGDTFFDLDPAQLHHAAERVSADAPVLILTRQTPENPLRSRDGVLIGIGDVTYAEHDETDADRADDFGIKVFHASIRDHLPAAPTTLSFHGTNGLVGRLAAAGKQVLVQPVAQAERVEIGTVEDYEARGENAALRDLSRRLASWPQR